MTHLDGEQFPRLLSAVFAVVDDGRTLVHTPFGVKTGPAGMYALLDRVGPALDGTRRLRDVLRAVPSRYEATVRRMIELLVGAQAIRMERCTRPQGVGDELLAFLDLHTEDPYDTFHDLLNTPRYLWGPGCWTYSIRQALATHGLGNVRLTSGTDEPVCLRGGASLGIRDLGSVYEMGPGAGDHPLRNEPGEVIRHVVSAVMVERYLVATVRSDQPSPRRVHKATGNIIGYSDHPSREVAEPLDVPIGLEGTLHDEAPTPAQLERLLCDASAVLPQGPSGVAPPAMVRRWSPGSSDRHRGPSTGFADIGPIGRLLALAYGVSRVELGGGAHGGASVHRTVASARAFFPTELYVLDSSGGGWYVDPVARRLRPMQHGLRRPDLTGQVRLVLSVREGKTAFRYQKYATRLCAQEVALVCESLRIVAQELGMVASAELTVHGRGSSSDLGARLSLLNDERPIVTLTVSEGHDASHGECRMLASALNDRTSGHAVFNSLSTPRDPFGLTSVLRAIVDSDTEGVRCYVAVPPGMCLAPGLHEVTSDGPQLIRDDPSMMDSLQAIHPAAGVLSANYASMLGAMFVTVPEHGVTADISEFFRWNILAGRVVQRVVVAAAKEQVCARIHNGFDPRSLSAVLEFSVKELTIFQILIGNANPDGTLTFPASTLSV